MAQSIFGAPPTEVISNYTPHSGQDEVSDLIAGTFQSKTPPAIIEIIASRGWGKTLYMVCEMLVPFLNRKANAKVMWVAPTYQIGMAPIEDVFNGTDEITGKRWVPEFDHGGRRIWKFSNGATGPQLKWFNGSTVSFRSADSPESIVSRGYDLIIIDEAALIQEKVFLQQIMGTARKGKVKIFMITSPRGKRHWTHRIYLKGQDAKDTMYVSIKQPYYKNPFFNKTLEKLIKDLPDWIYRQEYLAEFIDDGDTVIKGLENIIMGPEISFEGSQQEWADDIREIAVKDFGGERKVQPHERRFVVGLDLAKSIDFTVLWVMDLDNGECVYYRRLNKTDYRQVLEETVRVCKKYNEAELIYDATGVGSGLADFINNYDVNAHPYVFTNASKNDLINRLMLAVEHQEIKVPNIATVKSELGAFTYTLTRTGKISYNAPAGFHDDIVIAIALANWYRVENSASPTQVNVVEDIINFNNRSSKSDNIWDRMANDND